MIDTEKPTKLEKFIERRKEILENATLDDYGTHASFLNLAEALQEELHPSQPITRNKEANNV